MQEWIQVAYIFIYTYLFTTLLNLFIRRSSSLNKLKLHMSASHYAKILRQLHSEDGICSICGNDFSSTSVFHGHSALAPFRLAQHIGIGHGKVRLLQ